MSSAVPGPSGFCAQLFAQSTNIRQIVEPCLVQTAHFGFRSSGSVASQTDVTSEAPVKDRKKRAAVSAEAGHEVGLNTPTQIFPKTKEQKEHLREATKGIPLFAGLNAESMDDVIDAMFERECMPGENIIVQGDLGDNFYVVDSGEYAVMLKQKGRTPVHFYKAGDSFGELALMYNTPRAATVQCVAPGTLWALGRISFRTAVMANNHRAAENTSQFLKSVSFLSSLTDQQRDAVGSVLVQEHYNEGDVIVRQGERAEALYVVKSGSCSAFRAEKAGKKLGKEVARMTEGGVFGESALSADDAVRQASVVAAEDGTVMFKLNKKDFTSLLGDLRDLMNTNFNKKILGSMEMFRVLSRTQQAILVDSLQEERFVKDEDIICQGDEGTAFYIIISGSVRVWQVLPDDPGEKVLIKDKLSAGAYFGEMALMQEATRFATVTANEDTIVMSLDRQMFSKLVGSMSEMLRREAERRSREIERKTRPPIKLDDLEMLQTLGVGTFGRVKMVKHTPSSTPYALKCMRKGQMVAMRQVEHVRNEKRILESIDHPFLLNLVATFQDDKEIFMVFELVLGGELFTVLRARKRFDIDMARFYCACVASGFTYLHERQVVYRDLKPENLLFDADGYVKIVDFGFAKLVQEKTYTLCGTPDYLAPEIIQNKGHGLSADWWSFGVLVYECLVGHAPFEADDPMDIYDNILHTDAAFPCFFNGVARHLIDSLLDRNPISRLGSLGLGSLDVIEHDFFDGLNFSELERREVPAPYVPDIANPFDAANFDYDEEEDAYDSDDPYDETAQQIKQWETYNTNPSLFVDF